MMIGMVWILMNKIMKSNNNSDNNLLRLGLIEYF